MAQELVTDARECCQSGRATRRAKSKVLATVPTNFGKGVGVSSTIEGSCVDSRKSENNFGSLRIYYVGSPKAGIWLNSQLKNPGRSNVKMDRTRRDSIQKENLHLVQAPFS